MLSFDKDTKKLDDKKEEVVTTPFTDNKLLTTEKVTTIEEVHKRTKHLDDKKEAVVMTPLSDKKLLTTEKVTTSEEVEKGTEKLEGMKEAVVMICRKDSDKFEGQSKGYMGWFNLDRDYFKRKFSTLEPDLYEKLYEKDIEVQDMEAYKTFSAPFDTNKLNLFMRNYSVKNRENNIASDDEEASKNSESSSEKKK